MRTLPALCLVAGCDGPCRPPPPREPPPAFQSVDASDATGLVVAVGVDVRLATGTDTASLACPVRVDRAVRLAREGAMIALRPVQEAVLPDDAAGCALSIPAGVTTLRSEGAGDVTALGRLGLSRIEIGADGDVRIGTTTGAALSVQATGPGTLRVMNASGSEIDVTVQGPGVVALSGIAASAVDVTLDGPGDVTLAGTVATVSVAAAGPGRLDASGLRADEGVARLSGSGSVDLSVAGTLRGHHRGTGPLSVPAATVLAFDDDSPGAVTRR